MKKDKNRLYFSNQTVDFFNWTQNSSQIINNEKINYCINKNHYVTQPHWKTCEICNGLIQGHIKSKSHTKRDSRFSSTAYSLIVIRLND